MQQNIGRKKHSDWSGKLNLAEFFYKSSVTLATFSAQSLMSWVTFPKFLRSFWAKARLPPLIVSALNSCFKNLYLFFHNLTSVFRTPNIILEVSKCSWSFWLLMMMMMISSREIMFLCKKACALSNTAGLCNFFWEASVCLKLNRVFIFLLMIGNGYNTCIQFYLCM